MARNRIALDNARCKLIELENQYYRAASEYLLLMERVTNPSEKIIRETKKLLTHTYFGLSILLANPLTQRELDAVYQASCGEEQIDTAVNFKVTESSIKKFRISAFKKLQSENIAQAVYRATRLGYLPLKDKQLSLQSTEIEEFEGASV
jgi:DNA-binding NarL/FixJ family response regulator